MGQGSFRSIRYPKVPTDWDQRFLYQAANCAAWSKDPSTRVGAVAVRDRRVLATGYNGLPRGIVDSPSRLLNRELKLQLTIHAETNMILSAAHHGVCLVGATAFVYPLAPCVHCATALIQVGIERVVVPDFVMPQRWADSFELAQQLFLEASVSFERLPLEGPLQCAAASDSSRDSVDEAEDAAFSLA